MLRKMVSFLDQARQGVYYEAYELWRKNDPDDYLTPTMMVGAVDAGALAGIAFLLARIFSLEHELSGFIPDSIIIKTMPELFAAIVLSTCVFVVEAFYFRYVTPARDIVKRLDALDLRERSRIRRKGLFYAFFIMIGGAVFAILV